MPLAQESECTRLPERWRGLARLTWLVLVALLLWLFVNDTWLMIANGLSVPFRAWQVVMPVGFVMIGGVIFWRWRDDCLALMLSLVLVLLQAASQTWARSSPDWMGCLPCRFSPICRCRSCFPAAASSRAGWAGRLYP